LAVITSLQNERIKLVRALQSQGKARRKAGQVVLEGVRLIADAMATGSRPDFVLYTPDAVVPGKPGGPLLESLRSQGAICFEVTPEVMAHAADTESPQGMLAAVATPQLPVPTTLALALILDGIADPGNLGTILRTAAAAGVDLVILAPGCVDPFNPKVLRSGMGAHFRVPVIRRTWPDITAAYDHLPFYLADASGGLPYHAVDWGQPAALMIGSEAHGAAAQARQLARASIFIPMSNAAESLNAAAAAAVILFEARRQRTGNAR
jgi:TrmH family RNA methyltransferase